MYSYKVHRTSISYIVAATMYLVRCTQYLVRCTMLYKASCPALVELPRTPCTTYYECVLCTLYDVRGTLYSYKVRCTCTRYDVPRSSLDVRCTMQYIQYYVHSTQYDVRCTSYIARCRVRCPSYTGCFGPTISTIRYVALLCTSYDVPCTMYLYDVHSTYRQQSQLQLYPEPCTRCTLVHVRCTMYVRVHSRAIVLLNLCVWQLYMYYDVCTSYFTVHTLQYVRICTCVHYIILQYKVRVHSTQYIVQRTRYEVRCTSYSRARRFSSMHRFLRHFPQRNPANMHIWNELLREST